MNQFRATITLDIPFVVSMEMVEPSNVYRTSITLDIPYVVEMEAE